MTALNSNANREKWNTACDIMFQTIYSVDSNHRAEIRGEGCCHELETIKSMLLDRLTHIRI